MYLKWNLLSADSSAIKGFQCRSAAALICTRLLGESERNCLSKHSRAFTLALHDQPTTMKPLIQPLGAYSSFCNFGTPVHSDLVNPPDIDDLATTWLVSCADLSTRELKSLSMVGRTEQIYANFAQQFKDFVWIHWKPTLRAKTTRWLSFVGLSHELILSSSRRLFFVNLNLVLNF